MDEIWFWQSIVSPHTAGLVGALACRGREVTYVACETMTADRLSLGWKVPDLGRARLRLARDRAAAEDLAMNAPPSSIHICEGIRGNAQIGMAQQALTRSNIRQWVLMETVDDEGAFGLLKRLEYGRRFRTQGRRLQGVLAMGHRTADWVVARGMPADRVFEFAYFLSDREAALAERQREGGPVRFLFVGSFIALKRLELLITILHSLMNQQFELVVVGSGPLEQRLRERAHSLLPGRVRWLGRLPQDEVPSIMAQADCLVLPSRHDGWGAVISEALMTGTPVICSDVCGAAGVVRASDAGGVFRAHDAPALGSLLGRSVAAGPVAPQQRKLLASWGRALGAQAGSRYLLDILHFMEAGGARPSPPWQAAMK